MHDLGVFLPLPIAPEREAHLLDSFTSAVARAIEVDNETKDELDE
jgi:hypothetical protein